MTDADLVVWLEKVATHAAREGERWRGLRLPGDLKLSTTTDDRARLHVVGQHLGAIETLAKVARDVVLALRPKPTGIRPGAVRPECTGFLRVGCGEEFAPPEVAKCTGGDVLCAGCKARKLEREAGPKCCDRAGEYDGQYSGCVDRFTCAKGCACHD